MRAILHATEGEFHTGRGRRRFYYHGIKRLLDDSPSTGTINSSQHRYRTVLYRSGTVPLNIGPTGIHKAGPQGTGHAGQRRAAGQCRATQAGRATQGNARQGGAFSDAKRLVGGGHLEHPDPRVEIQKTCISGAGTGDPGLQSSSVR